MATITRVGVLRGGPSSEYEVSLNSGAAVLNALLHHHDQVYKAYDIFIDKNGSWHFNGQQVLPHDALNRVDIIFNALHGTYGEDGKVQAFLENHGIPFSGTRALESAIAMNKELTKKIFKRHGIKTPNSKEVDSEDIRKNGNDMVREYFQTLHLPVVVKPTASGSSVGISIVRKYTELLDALNKASEHGRTVMIEEFIPGIEATCGVIENFRGHDLYALPPVEIRPVNHFFDYEAKYAGKSLELVPATFAHKIKLELEELARNIHSLMNLRHYSRSDFIIHPRRGIYVLEVNTLPGLTEESLIPKSLRAIGSDTHELVGHVLGIMDR